MNNTRSAEMSCASSFISKVIPDLVVQQSGARRDIVEETEL